MSDETLGQEMPNPADYGFTAAGWPDNECRQNWHEALFDWATPMTKEIARSVLMYRAVQISASLPELPSDLEQSVFFFAVEDFF
jgi:hypothetical protein